MPKNIVVLSDGTGQEGGRGHDTNIYKLFRMLEDRTPRQIVFYDQGLGTDWKKVTGNAFGAGFSQNILQCYRFIYDNYESGDKIFLLGFSRGAATVRSLANFIHYFGILPKARPELIRRAWKIYKRGKEVRPETQEAEAKDESLLRRFANQGFDLIDRATERVDSALRAPLNERAAAFVREHPNQWVSIDFLGVWDTVPALGLVPLAGLNTLINNIPWWKHRFHDFKLHKSVNFAYHAISIDDDRLWFHPTIWKECDPGQKVEQVWFAGSHTDVGGGFAEAGLSDISLEWMVEKAVSHGLRLYLGSRRGWNFVVAPDAVDQEHPPRTGFGKVYAFARRDKVWDEQAFDFYGPPVVHQSVLDRFERLQAYRPWLLDQYREEYYGRLPEKFAESLETEYAGGYDRAFEAYAEQMMAQESGEMVEEPPASREEWMAAYPFERWLAEEYGEYDEYLKSAPEPKALADWLETYPKYQAWLKKNYPQLVDTPFGRVAVEPYGALFQYQDAAGARHYTAEDLSEQECAERGFTNKTRVKFRDYDRDTLSGMIEGGLDRTPRGAFEDLLERVLVRRKKGTWNRYVYDRKRWYEA